MKIFITGGLGSLGRRLGYYFAQQPHVERVILFGRNEYQLYCVEQLFKEMGARGLLESSHEAKISFFQGDIRDPDRLAMALGRRDIDVVIHAAALKRVDVALSNPTEIQQTNIDGTSNVLRASLNCGVRRFVFVSSDKAVEPANIYGASKFFAEELVNGFNVFSEPQGMRCNVVRYGNVLGSRGSVYWIWRKLLLAMQTIPITDNAMTRFFITFDQAVATIELAIMQGRAGDIIIPNLESYYLPQFLEAMVRAYDNLPYQSAHVGKRLGGEKLNESLITANELTKIPNSKKLFRHHEFFVFNERNQAWPIENHAAAHLLNSEPTPATHLSTDELTLELRKFHEHERLLSRPDVME